MLVEQASAAGWPDDTPVNRNVWVYSVAILATALVIVPIADFRLTIHLSLIIAFFILIAVADLLTAHLLLQQFLAGGRPATLGLSSAYLYASVTMVPYVFAFNRGQRSTTGTTWTEVCVPWLFFAVFTGFPVMVAVQHWVVAALPARLIARARKRRRTAAAVATVAVITLVIAVTGIIVGAADRLPPFWQSGGMQTPAARWMGCAALLATAASLLTVIRGLRHRPPVERWVVVAMSSSLATTILYLAAPYRFTIGWYAARIALLISAWVVLLALLSETANLYRRLSAAHDDLDRAHRELSRRAERLTVVNLDLEAAGTWKSDVIATLSHEINQPLAVISACTEELTHEWDTLTDDERRAAAQGLGRRVNQLLDMAAQLLALCHAEPGEIHANPAALPVEQALNHVMDNLSRQARTRVTATYGPPGTAVWADPIHTHEVLTNFVTNAVKYSPGEIHVSADVDDTGDGVLFTVSDEGNGVPPDFVAHLFDRFAQAERSGGARTGVGFGLYLSKLLAEANRGQVWYEDVVPHGGRFVLRLPRARPGSGTAASRDPVDGAATDPFPGPRKIV
ncbi:Signal transduction histidine kinase [Actinoplanes regularis]|uniref:histidine kinase n=1 Tax=Actinoplanes regularis TaxID=52697 RepID=A0A238Z4I0_9ACTN|nr:Signal transduction histidine kinase [Actinoplanes regularis]